MRFGDDDDVFTLESSDETDRLWRTIIPFGHSLVEFSAAEARKIGLDPSRALPTLNNDTGAYGVSWAHGLHCLVSKGFPSTQDYESLK